MGKSKLLNPFWIGFLFILLMLIVLPSSRIKAAVVNANGIDDGITDWYQATSNGIGEMPINGGLKLGYSFGLAQNTSGKVLYTSGGDDTITKPTEPSVGGSNLLYYSKINPFLDYYGTYFSTVFQGGANSTLTNRQQVSSSSPDFMISAPNYNGSVTPKDYAVLGYKGSSTNVGLGNTKKYYIGSYNGHPAYKITGTFNRAGMQPQMVSSMTYRLKFS